VKLREKQKEKRRKEVAEGFRQIAISNEKSGGSIDEIAPETNEDCLDGG
jgi:hypothetical protein